MGTEIGPAEPKLLLPPPSGDHAVGSRAEDLLGRAPLAEAIAAQVAGADPETGVVFGLTGPWGSGKTSLLRMMKEALEEDHGGHLVLWFNPWLFTGTEQLIGVLFTELGSQLSDLSGAEWDELGATMQAFGATLSRLRTIPAVGGAAAAGGHTMSASGGRMRGAADEGASLYERRRRLEESLHRAGERNGRRLVIVVDDLDRLSLQEIRDLVALVKLNADLPNLHFVLAPRQARGARRPGRDRGPRYGPGGEAADLRVHGRRLQSAAQPGQSTPAATGRGVDGGQPARRDRLRRPGTGPRGNVTPTASGARVCHTAPVRAWHRRRQAVAALAEAVLRQGILPNVDLAQGGPEGRAHPFPVPSQASGGARSSNNAGTGGTVAETGTGGEAPGVVGKQQHDAGRALGGTKQPGEKRSASRRPGIKSPRRSVLENAVKKGGSR